MGYHTKDGFMGYVREYDQWVLFVSEEEYYEYISDR